MPHYHYKSFAYDGNLRGKDELTNFDDILNDAASRGWELVATTPVANSLWTEGETTAVIMTFRKEKRE